MLVGPSWGDKTPARILQGSKGPTSVPSAASVAVDCVLHVANSLDLMTVVDCICKVPVNINGAAVTLMYCGLVEQTRVLAEESPGFEPLRDPDCFVAIAHVSDLALAPSRSFFVA